MINFSFRSILNSLMSHRKYATLSLVFALYSAPMDVSADTSISSNIVNIGEKAHIGSIVIDNNNIHSANTITTGIGKIIKEERNLPSFSIVDIRLSADIEIVQHPSRQLTISSNKNVLPLISTQVKDQTLVISNTASFISQEAISIKIKTPTLTSIQQHGAGTVNLYAINQPKLFIQLNGSGDITAEGKVSKLVALLNGSGDLNLGALHALHGQLDLAGAGDISITVENHFSATISGAGNITYCGSPTIKQHIDGAGELIQNCGDNLF
ncbi:hypothetical protein MNBD_GAMMA16-165 [hydrothermal vent metagenome]|uniref:Putative auto-transporter adhesin head GIN domain-containing protein n=1 Tax=hydrothermal vent metagenome TaxID=652676 RepID=A0A3B0ZGW9_9ZZZZ